jgi:hypothetical protein
MTTIKFLNKELDFGGDYNGKLDKPQC